MPLVTNSCGEPEDVAIVPLEPREDHTAAGSRLYVQTATHPAIALLAG